MTLFLIIGILIPVIYVLRLIIKEYTIGLKEMLVTVVLSMIGIAIFTVLGVLISGQDINIATLILASLITGAIWGILLSSIYKLFNYLRHTFRK
ncbi:hypothetical protein ACYCJX_11340 [Staphylococcus borealis]|uniref:hypothetical protein n=1 Tax=Staphylococcus borealis TaxID=2742203 RepID=UPI000FF7459E|nr:hypothetical protein [Staphylococcus borealis]MDM7863262.1 hypothetical protein [Staphylococcus borealis]MDM7881838.1 hypothetical protein [Staphylococcus borealis]RIO94064.1 hypothetical protein BUZ39_01840 [Staphylococcus haemolyticus]